MSKEELLHLEEHFHKQDRKQHRKDRKAATFKDRSKFKKTDQKKKPSAALLEEGHQRGRILSITADGIIVESDHVLYQCQLRGSFKQQNMRLKNLTAIGDFVHFLPMTHHQGVIVHIEERYSILSRADTLAKTKQQLIAVNIDQVLITVSVVAPALKPFLVDRYIIAAKKGNMQPIIVVNKIDLLQDPSPTLDEERKLYADFYATYQKLGIPIFPISAVTGEGSQVLSTAMKDKASVFSGQSGVGKSSLINLIAATSLEVGAVVEKTGKGSHTTTSTHLIPLLHGGFCIDTPGIRSFGIWDLGKEDLQNYFSEISALRKKCKFPDCSHLQEPGCAVKKAVDKGTISSLRFASYLALMEGLSEGKLRR